MQATITRRFLSHQPTFQMNPCPAWVWKGTVPGLNGIRAIAILFVIVSHFRQDLDLSWALGHLGVTCFFVLSGFLITLLMIRERQRTKDVSLTGFYWRRALRIFPAYFTFLFVTWLLTLASVFNVSTFSWIAVLTYTSCFWATTVTWNVGHTWSLSVEEHFYLIWPMLFRWASAKTGIALLLAYLAATPVIRYVLFTHHYPALDIDYCSPSQMSSIAVGCVIAFLVTGQCWPKVVQGVQRLPLAPIAAGVLLLVASVVALRSHKTLHHVLMDPVRSAAFGLILLGLLYGKSTDLAHRVLNSRVLHWIGLLSYSLYLWQEPFIYRRLPIGLPLSLVLLLATACLSYYLIEQPFLKLKRRSA